MKGLYYLWVVLTVMCSVISVQAMRPNLFLLAALAKMKSSAASSVPADEKRKMQSSEASKPHVESGASKEVASGEKKGSHSPVMSPVTWPKPRG